MPYTFRSILSLVVLVVVLAVAPASPEAANVIFLALGAVSIPLIFWNGIGQFRRPVVWMTLAGVTLVAIAYGFGAKSIDGLAGLIFFAPVFAIWPLLSSAQDMKGISFPSLVGVLSLAGVGAAAAIAVMEVATTGTTRAGETVANPIHFADVALLVGFIACAGMIAANGKSRFVFVAGPVLAGVAVILSGTRGAIVAIAAMVVIAGVMLLVLRLVSMRSALLAVGVLTVAGLVAALLGAAQLSGIERVLIDIAEVLRTGLPTDGSTDIRLGMMRGGWESFLLAPIFGHGPFSFTTLANQLSSLPPESWPHLHNDLVDFAASAGIFGLVAYVLLLAAPVVEVVRMPPGPAKAPILVLVSTLIGGFFVMGITNAMFGILTVTTIYSTICVITGILVAQSNDAPTSENVA